MGDWRRSIQRALVAVLVIIWVMSGTGIAPAVARTIAAPPTPAALEIPNLTDGVEKLTLDNGMTVLLKKVHTAPVVAVQLWYRVGSADETVGNSGISHQLEHLLFKGTEERPIQFGRLF
ncbi:MAG: insulinase family protein, partial [Cyanobacteria bacterium P01_G01_bin.4]